MVKHRKKGQPNAEGGSGGPSRNMTIGLAVGGGLLLAALSMKKKNTEVPPPTPQPGRGPSQDPFSPPDPGPFSPGPDATSPGPDTTGSATGPNASSQDFFYLKIADAAFAAYASNNTTMTPVERFKFAADVSQNRFSWLAVDMPDNHQLLLREAIQIWVASTRWLASQTKEEMAGWLKAYYTSKFKK